MNTTQTAASIDLLQPQRIRALLRRAAQAWNAALDATGGPTVPPLRGYPSAGVRR